MNNELERRKDGSNLLSPERRLMNEALARIGAGKEHCAAAGSRPEASWKAGRLVVVLDLTGSRKPSLRQARVATAAMFDAIKRIGSVAVKLIYYRGLDECRAGNWESDPEVVSRIMLQLSCDGGATQIGRALRCVLEREKEPVSGIVFIGDHCEDDPDEVVELAAMLGAKQTPIFLFHECEDTDKHALVVARPVFQRMAEVSGGTYSEFDPESDKVLSELLSTVAAFSAAGTEGVERVEQATTPQARQLQTRLLLAAPPRKGNSVS